MAIYIAPAAMGLGDLIVALPVVRSLVAAGEQVYLVVRMEEHVAVAQRLVGLAGVVREWQFDAGTLRSYDRFYDLRDHDLQREFWWGSRPFKQKYPLYLINDLLNIICTDLGLTVDFTLVPKLLYEPVSEVRSKVVFVPGSAVEAKCWSSSNWLLLAEQLRAERLDCVVVGQPEESQVTAELVLRGITWCQTADLADAVDVLSSCRAVISVDTGLMHLSANQGTPTVGIFRHAPVYIRPMQNFTAVIAAEPCAEQCHTMEVACAHHHKSSAGQNFQPTNWQCPVADAGSHCLETLTPQLVLQQLIALLSASPSVR